MGNRNLERSVSSAKDTIDELVQEIERLESQISDLEIEAEKQDDYISSLLDTIDDLKNEINDQ
jgi:cell division protein FtsB